MPKKLTTIEFKNRAENIHGATYDLSLVEYINSGTKVKIICRIHGIFEISPANFIHSKSGCMKCASVKSGNSSRLCLSDFINRSHKTHGNTYDYSKSSYVNSTTKISIICKIHGIFEQFPYDHMNGRGCNKCSGTVKSSTTDFVVKAIIVHGSKFDYSEVEYTNAKTKVKIGCSIHGSFLQIPNDHLSGRGCKQCSQFTANATKVQKGLISANPKDIDIFRRKVRHLSLKSYSMFKEMINPLNYDRGNEYHLDHKVSILEGFQQGLTCEELSHPCNLQILPAIQNRQKNVKSCITIDELRRLISSHPG